MADQLIATEEQAFGSQDNEDSTVTMERKSFSGAGVHCS